MADNKEKIQFFVGGVLLGLIIAGSFFIFKLDDYFEQLKLYKNITKTFYLNTTKDKTEEELENDKTTAINNFKKEEAGIKKTLPLKNEMESNQDTIRSASLSDSLTDFISEEGEMENIVIQKDEKMATAQIAIIDLSPLSTSERASDSLLQKVSGVKDDRTVLKKNMETELWKSPLHYKGYKMSKNKLILYGFPTLEGIKIFKMEDVTYLKVASNFYKLEQTYDYKAYQHIEDQGLITKLK
jgi:hypothetical protein